MLNPPGTIPPPTFMLMFTCSVVVLLGVPSDTDRSMEMPPTGMSDAAVVGAAGAGGGGGGTAAVMGAWLNGRMTYAPFRFSVIFPVVRMPNSVP